VPGHDLEDIEQGRQRFTGPVEHSHGRGLDPGVAKLPLKLYPQRDTGALGIRPILGRGFVHRVNRGQPDDACALASGDLDCDGIETAGRGVQRDRPEH
jgi:hypothetical protein